jgi:hypothetical protein
MHPSQRNTNCEDVIDQNRQLASVSRTLKRDGTVIVITPGDEYRRNITLVTNISHKGIGMKFMVSRQISGQTSMLKVANPNIENPPTLSLQRSAGIEVVPSAKVGCRDRQIDRHCSQNNQKCCNNSRQFNRDHLDVSARRARPPCTAV